MSADARKKLAKWMEDHGVSGADLARCTRTSEAQISRVLKGSRSPSPPLATAIAETTGGEVPASAWFPWLTTNTASKTDDEAGAIATLAALTPESRARVMAYASARWGTQ